MHNKKGQGLSMTTIVIAAISLLVLVVLVLIFTGRLNIFSKGVEESSKCETFCKSLGMAKEGGLEITGTAEDRAKLTSTDKCGVSKYIPAITIKDGDKSFYCCCK